MRDISVSAINGQTGLADFAIANITQATGINALVAKVTKKLLSSSFATTLFTYYGLDLQSIPSYGISNTDVSAISAMLNSKLENITTSIQNNTSSKALATEKLASLNLTDLVLDNTNKQILVKITLNPVQGDSQVLLFPLGV